MKIKIRVILTVFWVLSMLSLWAQKEYQLITLSRYVALSAEAAGDDFKVKYSIEEQEQSSFSVKNVRLERGDLVVDYKLPDLGKFADITHFNIELSLCHPTESGEFLRPCLTKTHAIEEMLFGDYREVQGDPGQNLQLRWAGFLELVKPFKGSYILEMQAVVFGEKKIDCLDPPSFDANQQLPYWIVAGLGVGLTASSFIVERDADAIYEDYLRQITAAEADPLLTRANEKRQTYLLMRYTGVGLVLIDGVFAYLRYRRFKEDKDYYTRICNGDQKTSLRPALQIQGAAMAGLSFKWRF